MHMDDKKAAEILIGIMKKYKLAGEEKEAVESAVGLFSWTSLAKSRLKRRKDKIEKDNACLKN